jgi:hypothetical protein
VISGGGTGYNGGEWVAFPSGWTRQWFYDHPPDPDRWKTISAGALVEVQWTLADWEAGIAVSYSAPHYSNPDAPPVDEADIIQEVLWEGSDPLTRRYGGYHVIEDYNPEWVSIDVYAWNYNPTSDVVYFDGDITHECLPEPATLMMLAIGVLGLLFCAGRGRRR